MRLKVMFLIFALSLQFLSCGGSSSTGPQPSPPTPSELTITFTGQAKSDSESEACSMIIDTAGLRTSTDGKGTCQVTATWTECTDSDFSKYDLFRSTSSDIQSNPAAATLVFTSTSSDTVTYVDNDITWETEYFYAVRTTDSDNLDSWSNEESITTPSEGDAPTPSILSLEFTGSTDALSAVSFSSAYTGENRAVGTGSGVAILSRIAGKGFCEATATWTQCPDVDFANYTLYRSEHPDVSQDTTIAVNLGTFTGVADTVFADGAVAWETTYYYALVTRNTGANYAWSNEEEITTYYTK